jgi:hypothetical protein
MDASSPHTVFRAVPADAASLMQSSTSWRTNGVDLASSYLSLWGLTMPDAWALQSPRRVAFAEPAVLMWI